MLRPCRGWNLRYRGFFYLGNLAGGIVSQKRIGGISG